MNDYQRCKKCREFGWVNTHICPPIWEARMHETKFQDEWNEVYAHDGQEAASKFAEQYDQGGDYDIIRRGGAEVEVRKLGEEEIKLMDVSAESVPEYHAYERSERT